MTAEATVTVSRSAYEALLAELEDAQDRATLVGVEEREGKLGKDEARRSYLPIDQVERLLAGENSLLVWREHRGLSRTALERTCALPRGRLAALERGEREASAKELAALAEALGAPFEELGAHDAETGPIGDAAPTEAAASPDVSVIERDADEEHLYRIVRVASGYLVTMRMRSRIGLLLSPAEWLFRTEEAARASLPYLKVFNRLWRAIVSGKSTEGLEQEVTAAYELASDAMSRLGDQPLIGEEVRDLRRRLDVSLGEDVVL